MNHHKAFSRNHFGSELKESALRLRPFWAAVILFAAASFLSLKIADVYQDSARHVVNVKRAWAKDPHFIQPEEGRDLVFFMGDSKIAAGLLPEEFDRAANGRTKSYNTSLPGLPLAPHYFWLKDYLENHKKEAYPDYIVLRLKPAGWDFFHFLNYAIQGAGASEVFQYYFLTGNEEILINYFVPLRFNWPLIRRFIIGQGYRFSPESIKVKIKQKYRERQKGRETYAHDWEYFFETQFVRPFDRWKERKAVLEETRGRYGFREARSKTGSLPKTFRFVKKGEWGEAAAIEGVKDPFVEKFFELTRKSGIRVILINDYIMPSQEKTEQTEKVPEFWKDLARHYEHVTIMPGAEKAQVYPNSLFSDPLHLTKEGAEQFSAYIAGQFLQISTAKNTGGSSPSA